MSTDNDPPEFGMYQVGDLPEKLIIEIRTKSTDLIEKYTISFVSSHGLRGSGTLVNVSGCDGILTAYHVSREIFKEPKSRIGINIKRYSHSFNEAVEHLEHYVIGKQEGAQDESGPDLAFVRLLNPVTVGTIRSTKSFAYISDKSFNKDHLRIPPYTAPVYLVGAPAEMSGKFVERGIPGVSAAHFVGESTLESLTERNGFDYVKLRLIAGDYTFPLDYRGFSGGGVWLVPFTIDPDRGTSTVGHIGPFFVGVAFYQSDLEGAERIITCHGPLSVHQRVPQFFKH